jgi:hypothetical protein
MRWVLAGLAFALLIALAVLTVAIKARNLALRAKIANANQDIRGLRVEWARRVDHRRPEVSTDELIRRLRRMAGAGSDGSE